MTVSLNTAQIAFTSRRKERTQEQKDAEKKVITGGGAAAATASASRLKGTKTILAAKQASEGMKGVTTATKTAANVAKKSKDLWTTAAENVKWAKEYLLKIKFIKPLAESKILRGCAGFLGYGFGAVTLISGGADIIKVATETAENGLLNKKA